MKRRTALAGVAALATPFGGCLGGSEPGVEAPNTTADEGTGMDGTDDPTDGGSDGAPVVRSASLSARDACPEASIEADGGTVVCRGCVRGRNGCTVAVLEGATYDADAGELRVVVATEEDRDDGMMCTQAIVNLGYEVTVELDGGRPETVVLVEDDVDGRREAGIWSV